MLTRSIPHRLFERGITQPTLPAYHTRAGDGSWTTTTWAGYAEQVRRAARAFIALGFQPGDTVGLLGFNRPEWAITCLASMAAGGAPAGIYPTSAPGEIAYILAHVEAEVVLVDSEAQLLKVLSRADDLPRLRWIIALDDARSDDPRVLPWREFLELGALRFEEALAQRLDAIREDSVASYIYTSGTTGTPKAAMLTHRNITWTGTGACEVVGVGVGDRLVSYLPLSHIAEQMFSVHGSVCGGFEVFWARSIDPESLIDDLRSARPTAFFGVPRIWEKIHTRVLAEIERQPAHRRAVARWALSVGAQAAPYLQERRAPPPWLAARLRVARRLVLDRIRDRIGLSEAHLVASGAAPIAPDVLATLASMGLLVQEVYGQSESTGPTTFNLAGQIRFGSVGRAVPGMEVRVAEGGEVWVRGPNVFAGYYKDRDATQETLTPDGWLKTGDIGRFDADGYLFITGRKKEILITSGGKNIAPNAIEAALLAHPFIAQAVVIGDRRPFLAALIAVDHERARAARAGTDTIHAAIDAHVAKVNTDLSRAAQIRRFKLLDRELDQEHGELTPTLKLKRNVINTRYAAEIDAMYG